MQILPGDLNKVSTSPFCDLGTEFTDKYRRIYKYVKGAATIAQYSYGVISADGNFTFTALDTDTAGHGSGKVQALGCVQLSAGLTSLTYGFVFIGGGLHTGLFAASCVQNVPIYPTATAGVVDDASGLFLIPGLFLVTTITSATSASAYCAGKLQMTGV